MNGSGPGYGCRLPWFSGFGLFQGRLVDGRPNASREDVRNLAKSALRHRILPSFLAESEGLSADDLIDFLLKKVSD